MRNEDSNPGNRAKRVFIRFESGPAHSIASRTASDECTMEDSSPTGRAQQSEHVRVRFESGPAQFQVRHVGRFCARRGTVMGDRERVRLEARRHPGDVTIAVRPARPSVVSPVRTVGD